MRTGVVDADRGLRGRRPGAWPAFYAELERALRVGGPPPVDPADAVATLEVINAARSSAAERQIVPA